MNENPKNRGSERLPAETDLIEDQSLIETWPGRAAVPPPEESDDPGPPHWNAPRNVSVEEWDDDEDTQPTGVRRSNGRDPREREGGVTEPAPPPSYMKADAGQVVAKLNECLRGERSAVETYELALATVHDGEVARILRQIRDNHERRVMLLDERVRGFGGEPAQSSGAWGLFAKLMQRGADLFGDRAAMRVLEEGEDHGLKKYSEDLDTFDPITREFVMTRLLPDQHRTHELCRSLERFVKAA